MPTNPRALTCRRCGDRGYYRAELPDSGDTGGGYVKCLCEGKRDVCMFKDCDREAVWFFPDPDGIAGECRMCDECYTESAQ